MANPFIEHPDLHPPVNPEIPVNPLLGQPPVGLQPVQPEVPPPPQVEQRQPSPPETPADLATQKYGDDISKLRQGYNEQFTETQRILQETKALREQNQLLLERLVGGPQGKSPEDELAELGLPPAILDRFIEKAVETRLAPLARMAQAQAELSTEIPDFHNVAPQIQRYLASRPDLQAEYADLAKVNPKAASKYVWREFQASQPAPRVSAADTGLNRTNATIPTTNSTGARQAVERNWEDELMQARTYFEQTGDERPYWKIWNEWQLGSNPIHPSFSETPS